MTDKDLFRLQAPHFLIEGRSRAGHETWFRIRELGVALDIGRGPDAIVPMEHVFITHAHLDHAAGIPWYGGQRRLQQLEGGSIYVPAEAAEDVRDLLRVQARLTGHDFHIDIVGMEPGQEVRFGRTHLVRAHSAPHRVAARSYELFEIRHRLREEFAGLEREELQRIHREGVRIDEPYTFPVLFYTGDTDRGLLEDCEAAFRAEVLMIECSFIDDGHQERAAKYRHIHVDDIADFADRFQNELIVLTHFSRRYSRDQIRDGVRRRLPASLHERIRLALPEQWQRIV
jgi:ribonuclease Z